MSGKIQFKQIHMQRFTYTKQKQTIKRIFHGCNDYSYENDWTK